VFSELLTGTPLFKGQKDPDQLEKIIEKCGTPNEENWPGVTSLPNYHSMMPKQFHPGYIKTAYSDCKK
jgi:cyclin-dependent kinase 12/13